MRRYRLFSILLSLIFSSCMLFAQSSSTSTLSGDITDASGAVVPGAAVDLTDTSTNITQTTTTNQAGHYVFPSVPPGDYKMTVKKERFRQTTATLNISIGVNVSQNFKLEVGGANEIVEVQATGQELQTTDASVGNVLDRNTLQSLPSLSRDATALLQLQPMASPSYNAGPGASGGEGNTTSGGVAGALNDQNTFNLDGGDATSNTEGDANYNSGIGTPQAVVPTPVESIEEVRVTTNNSNTFARSSGAQVQLITRHGTNQWHGAGWEYNQNTDYNANFWQLNNAQEPRPVWQDNRFGGRIGGPIIKDKAFFFLMYEGRRFKKGETFTRNVPSALMRQGILQFQDANTGAIDQFNFAAGAPTAQCAGGPCDPRGLGMNPIVSQIWNTYEPMGNNPSEGDGLNFIGFDSTVPVISHENDGIARFDYNLSKNWTINAVGRYAVVDINGASQIDIGGLLPSDTLGVPKSTDLEPLQPRYYVLGLTGHIGSSITTDTHVDFLRHFWQWHRTAPFPQVSGLGAALQIYAESNVSGLVPMNIDTQNARSRIWNGKDYTLNEELSWLKGTHLFQFGGAFRHQHFYHVRDDKVVGGLAEPVYFAEWTSKHLDLSGYRPSTLVSGDEHNWDKAYAAVMGLIDHSAQLLTRSSDLTPNPPGTPNTANSLVDDYDIHFVDTWRFKPTFTLAYGLDWGYQTPPYETKGQQTVMVDAATNAILPFSTWSKNIISNALQGIPYVPTIGFMPVRQAGRKYPYDPDYHNFAPRLSLAWNPKGGANVFRLGYGRYFDRINGVGIVMTPALGIGFGNGVTCNSPTIASACNGAKTDPTDALRIGIDSNSVPIPPLATTTAPIIPGLSAATPYQSYDFRIDPKRKVGVEDTWTLNMQHRVNNGLMVELGYVGRVGRHLYSGNDVNQIPYMFTKSGQQFASAYDALMQPSQQAIIQNPNVCTGGTPATCPGITPQPFFEDPTVLGPGGTANIAFNTAGFTAIGDATDTFDYLNYATSTPLNLMPFDQQFLGADITTSNGNSFYNAGYASVREQMKNGLMFQMNYTWSHSLDDSGLAQEYVFFNPTDGFNFRRDYTNSYFDRRSVVTGFFVYDLPFGGKGRFRTGNFLDKIIGGWQISSAITASSGLPQKVYNFNSCAELGDGYLTQCAAWIPTSSAASAHFAVHHMPDGSINVYANPAAVSAAFRAPLFSDTRMGGTPIVGFGRWNVDSALTKTTRITERVSFGLTLQAVNVFNHMEFSDPTPDLSNTTTFGQTSTQYNTPRFLSIGGRIDF
ncbi:MAG TPA: carboxypeptidase-like regulatory domain-containing protein [Candidatus Sulfotelmatobacter sp.]|nr:carboxypeptidase-like regulatory domain-containing protein [Candidatus Sulfotelmatobacter sp.]